MNSFVPGEPQKSTNNAFGLNFVLSPKSHNFKSIHRPLAASKLTKIFSGFRSILNNIKEACNVNKKFNEQLSGEMMKTLNYLCGRCPGRGKT